MQEERSYSQEGGGGGDHGTRPDSPGERISISLPSTNSHVLKTGKTHFLFLRQVLNVGWVDVERCKLSLPVSLRSPAVKGLSEPLRAAGEVAWRSGERSASSSPFQSCAQALQLH